jgi:hypothetical protein
MKNQGDNLTCVIAVICSRVQDPGHGLASVMVQQVLLNAIFSNCPANGNEPQAAEEYQKPVEPSPEPESPSPQPSVSPALAALPHLDSTVEQEAVDQDMGIELSTEPIYLASPMWLAFGDKAQFQVNTPEMSNCVHSSLAFASQHGSQSAADLLFHQLDVDLITFSKFRQTDEDTIWYSKETTQDESFRYQCSIEGTGSWAKHEHLPAHYAQKNYQTPSEAAEDINNRLNVLFKSLEKDPHMQPHRVHQEDTSDTAD